MRRGQGAPLLQQGAHPLSFHGNRALSCCGWVQACAQTETEPVVAEASSALQPTQQQLTGRVARLAAQKDGSVRVQELSRPLGA